MTSSGGAWDNAQKNIFEEGHYGGKGSPRTPRGHRRPPWAILTRTRPVRRSNPMIKVVNIVAILIIPIFF